MKKNYLLLLSVIICFMLMVNCTGVVEPPIRQAADFPFDPERQHDRDFVPSGTWTQLSENLYRLDDCCNVYVVRNGSNGLLIDFGSGEVLDRLPDIGVTTIDRVLVTHHHRDQVQGLCNLTDRQFNVTVPAAEAHFFEPVEDFWDTVKLYINYNCRSHWNTVRKSIPVDAKVSGGDTIIWQGIVFSVIDTPGHTDGAVSYAAEIDGKRVVFSGDLIAGNGKTVNWFDLHWNYYGFVQGMNASYKSFAAIRDDNPAVLLPSHGPTIEKPLEAMAENSSIYETLRPMLIPNEEYRPSQEMHEILPHLVYLGGTGYAVISDSGKAFLYDYGYVDSGRINEFKEKYGVTTIDAVSFSHYHDDHCIRTYELQRREPTKIWIFENMVEIFEHPERFRLPCLLPFPIKADRVLRDGEKVQWEEFTFEIFHMPGQTEFHQGLATVIDGMKVMFTGDNTWKKIDHGLSRNGPIVPHNEYFLDGGFIVCAEKMLEYLPDIVCPSHTDEYSPTQEDIEEFLDWAHRVRDIMTGLIDQPDPNFGMDYRWCRFYPYRTVARDGGSYTVELMIRNHLFKPAVVDIGMKCPDNVTCAFPNRSIKIEPKKQVAVPFELSITGDGNRQIITADITINGRHLGEYAEAMIDVK
ncbi:MBL fold metallo-hydrolase [Candidatus Latescibacterota bacterium]